MAPDITQNGLEAGVPDAAPSASSRRRARYLRALNWGFAVFYATRLLTYLPTMWAIYTHGSSSQHSLLTWFGWAGANASMAAWLYEEQGRRFSRVAWVSAGNAVMCLATALVIYLYR